MSVGGGYSMALNDAVLRVIDAGVLVVVAAGNSASDACSYSPSSVSPALTVAATTNQDGQASFSNWGVCVDLYAPGENIYSAWNTDDNSMGTASGTSMATPHVVGAAALYLQANPTATPAQVVAALVGNATGGMLGMLGTGSPNKLLRVNGVGETFTPPPVDPSPTPNPTPLPNNIAPMANFTASCSKGNCTFNGSASSDDNGVTSFLWVFGDGSSAVSSANPMASHVYTQKGNYTVAVNLTTLHVCEKGSPIGGPFSHQPVKFCCDLCNKTSFMLQSPRRPDSRSQMLRKRNMVLRE
jgi:PKD repeat protein